MHVLPFLGKESIVQSQTAAGSFLLPPLTRGSVVWFSN
jgi:hypothetical protein